MVVPSSQVQFGFAKSRLSLIFYRFSTWTSRVSKSMLQHPQKTETNKNIYIYICILHIMGKSR